MVNDNQSITKNTKLKNSLINNNNALVKYYSFKKISLLNIGGGFSSAINKATEEFLHVRGETSETTKIDSKLALKLKKDKNNKTQKQI
jgi:hypothetical protein